MATAAPALTPIPAPPDFPVAWEGPADAHRLWQRESMHAPGQAAMVDFDYSTRAVIHGFNHACAAYEMPVRNRYGRFNTYIYQSIEPVSHDPEVLEELGRRSEAALGRAMAGQAARWENELLPELERMYERWDAFELRAAGRDELAAHLEETLAMAARAWEIHFLVVFPAALSTSLFDDFYRDVSGGGTFDSWALLQGLENMSTRADRALRELAARARRSPAIVAALRRGAIDEVRGPLGLDAYLAEWGKRLGWYFALSAPSYVDDPTPVATSLLEAIDGDRDVDAEQARLAAEREEAVAAARERLASYPAAVREQFDQLLAAAEEGHVLLESHNFYIDQRVSYEVQRVLDCVGGSLAADGLLDEPHDVVHLTFDEIGAREGLRALVAERKEELARWADAVAPPALGSLPPGAPPQDPVSRTIMKVFGDQPAEAAQPSVLHGMAGSPGTVRGVARVLRSLAEADRLAAGEVLVAESTAPPWTPLFARAAAVVTDSGGILSHCAVVAREYMIPAVVGTGRATVAVDDGALVEVDGTTGTVTIVG